MYSPTRTLCAAIAAFVLAAGAAHAADDAKKNDKDKKAAAESPMPEMPKPGKEHKWLQQLVGEWESTSEMNMFGQSMTGKGTEAVRAHGDFWIIADSTGTCSAFPGEMKAVLTLGFDAAAKKFVGTWVDSQTPFLWVYEGTLEGDKLTLLCDGPSMTEPGKTAKYREIIELKSPDHKIFTSEVQGADGAWTKMVTMDSKRKK